jgi:hypothetical protein
MAVSRVSTLPLRRQISLPSDPVVYVDRTPDMELRSRSGYGLRTAIVSGQAQESRYYSQVRCARVCGACVCMCVSSVYVW